MNKKPAKAALATLVAMISLATTSQSAKADYICYQWESNCAQDGRMGTSGNDILGLGGGDTLQKLTRIGTASAVGAMSGNMTLPIMGTVPGAVGMGIVTTITEVGGGIYETYKRERNADPKTTD